MKSLPPYGLRDPEYHAQPRPEDVDWRPLLAIAHLAHLPGLRHATTTDRQWKREAAERRRAPAVPMPGESRPELNIDVLATLIDECYQRGLDGPEAAVFIAAEYRRLVEEPAR